MKSEAARLGAIFIVTPYTSQSHREGLENAMKKRGWLDVIPIDEADGKQFLRANKRGRLTPRFDRHMNRPFAKGFFARE